MYAYPGRYGVIVVGGGHAGCEAALAAARMGCRVLLLTGNIDTIARMSCNPAIGGLGKGQLVREIDALGGEMGRNIDATGIQFRMLNKKKGPAVWAPRAQADRRRYQMRMKEVLEAQRGLDMKEEVAARIVTNGGRAEAVECLSGIRFRGEAIVLATGTFLGGLIHIGEKRFRGGRAGEPASISLSEDLKAIGFEMGRLKTGTPPRVNITSLDLERLERQEGDEPPLPFSFRTSQLVVEQMPCYIGHTNSRTHAIIRDNLSRSPLYTGRISATGVRYCPSIEDKVVKFPERESHQIFIEPEGRETREAYCNGISTSLPYEVQLEMIRSIEGMKRAEIMRPGYAIEYDYVLPTQLCMTLETKRIEKLFMAGQINGSSGYEEAAAQGFMAGVNAALRVKGEACLALDRSEAYIGVLIDDLVTKGTREPYRMFTSRAEYRLFLRQDNADLRLVPYGHRIGLVSDEMMERARRKKKKIEDALKAARSTRIDSDTIERMLRRPGCRYRDLMRIKANLPDYDDDVVEQIEIEARYAGYLSRQMAEIEKFRKMERRRIPEAFDFEGLRGLKKEAREKLSRVRPLSVGQAARISGVTPADISVLMLWLEKQRRAGVSRETSATPLTE